MSSFPVNDTERNLQEIIDQVRKTRTSTSKITVSLVQITSSIFKIISSSGNAILLADKDWFAIQSMPGIRESIKPITIEGFRFDGILIAEKDWSAIEETLYLLSIPEVGESIKEGLATPVEDCDGELDW